MVWCIRIDQAYLVPVDENYAQLVLGSLILDASILSASKTETATEQQKYLAPNC